MILKVYFLRPVVSYRRYKVVPTSGGPTGFSHPVVDSHDFPVESPEKMGELIAQFRTQGGVFLPGTENETGLPYMVAAGAILGYRCLEEEEEES